MRGCCQSFCRVCKPNYNLRNNLNSYKSIAINLLENINQFSERILMSDLLQQRHQIERRQPDKRRALYAVIDAEVIRDIDSLIPRSQRSKFLESVLRRELKELQAS